MAEILIDPNEALNEALLDKVSKKYKVINTCGGCNTLRTYCCVADTPST